MERRCGRGIIIGIVSLAQMAGVFDSRAFAQEAEKSSITQVPPVDEAAMCPGFPEFRARLRNIIRRKDATALLTIVDPDIYLSFGDRSGRAAFQQMWLSGDSAVNVWSELGHILDLGGNCTDQREGATDTPYAFVAPYVYSSWPNDLDGFDYSVITGSSVRLRTAPSRRATVAASLDYTVILRPDSARDQWVAVETIDGRKGFVWRQFVRSPIDMRAFFARHNGVWTLGTFIGGD